MVLVFRAWRKEMVTEMVEEHKDRFGPFMALTEVFPTSHKGCPGTEKAIWRARRQRTIDVCLRELEEHGRARTKG